MGKAIYKMEFSCGRQGDLYGIFVADEESVNEIVKSKRAVYFGEVLGKHSEICGNVEEHEITKISNNAADIEVFERLNLTSGYNPFDYLEEQDHNDDDDEFDDEDE